MVVERSLIERAVMSHKCITIICIKTMSVAQQTPKTFEIFTIDGLFSEDELTAFAEIIGNGDEKTQRFTSSPFKNGKVPLPKISDTIWHKVRGMLPDSYTSADGKTWRFIGTPTTVMFAEIDVNQQFGLHSDTGCIFAENGEVRSRHTLLIYLNDDIDGGGTQFFDESWKASCCVQPRRNRTLCFDIELFHQGNPVTRGRKRWLGTELIAELVSDV